MAVVDGDLSSSTGAPTENRKRVMSASLFERSFVKVRQRTKLIRRSPGRPQRCD
jgi:hypothetical protein